MYRVIDRGRRGTMCRDCISTVKKASLLHPNPAEICYDCTLLYDSLGRVTIAVHQRWPEDDVSESGSIPAKSGLKTLIAAGKVSIDDETGKVSIDNS